MIKVPRMYKVIKFFDYKSWNDMTDILSKESSSDKLEAWKNSEFFEERRDPFDDWIVFPKDTCFLIIDDDTDFYYGYIVDENARAIKVNNCKLYICIGKEEWRKECARNYFKNIPTNIIS